MFAFPKEDFKKLTIKEKSYFRVMYAKEGVLYLKGAPGLAKSAIIKSIARKLKMFYIDIRLSMMDETDVGLFPYRNDFEIEITDLDGNTKKEKISVMAHAVPEWAYLANQQPTIIHFEELNRAPLAVRNAALQILLDRSIGYKFKFNDSVFMCASGNLGEKDGTEVEEFDRALNNRLVHVYHEIDINEWVSEFANENVHPMIVNFVKSNPDHFYHSVDRKNTSENSDAYATPRSWTMLSKYITENFGKDSPDTEWFDEVSEIASGYVGFGAARRFIDYIDENRRLSLYDVMNNLSQVRDKLSGMDRAKRSELLNSLREYKVHEMTENQLENIREFLIGLSDDEVVAYMADIIDRDFDYIPPKSTKVSPKNDKINRFFNSHPILENHLLTVRENMKNGVLMGLNRK